MYAVGYKKDSPKFFINGILMTLVFFVVRIASIPVYWYKVYTILGEPLWTVMRHFRFIMIFTCVALDIINIFWFRKMFKGALIVWSTNWQNYEKSHKNKIELIECYRRLLFDKLQFAQIQLTNSMLYQSTKNGLNLINPSRYLSNNNNRDRTDSD